MFKRNIPNAITCGNLLCGCLAIVKCFEGDLVGAAYLVGIAAVLDFLDGFIARMLHVSSPIGKDLDSLADMVTFGVVPGIIMYSLIDRNLCVIDWPNDIGGKPCNNNGYDWFPYIAFIIPVFSAIRLAKFNNDKRQAESFIGLPTPANAIFLGALALIYSQMPEVAPNDGNLHYPIIGSLIFQPATLIVMTLILSFLLVAPIPLFALKFKHFKWTGNEIRFVFILWSILLLFFLQFIGIPLAILSYILFSVGNNWLFKNKNIS